MDEHGNWYNENVNLVSSTSRYVRFTKLAQRLGYVVQPKITPQLLAAQLEPYGVELNEEFCRTEHGSYLMRGR